MDNLDGVTRLPDDFSGRVRLFPLPELVVFPHAMQPLHIFEPRYCEMLAESMATDQLIAMATIDTDAVDAGDVPQILSGDATPPLASTVCIGKIVSHSEMEDDRHNILLVGIRRARIRTELKLDRSFRMADIVVIDDVYPAQGSGTRNGLKGKLLDAFGHVVPKTQSVQKNLYELMAGSMTLGPITDIIAYMMPFSRQAKLDLLAMANVDRRAEMVIDLLGEGNFELAIGDEASGPSEGGKPFPPPFSLN